MARRKAAITTITENTAHNFASSANVGGTLFCKQIPGFYIIKQNRGCSWRYRYTNAEGKRKVHTVGKYPSMIPNEAAAMAFDWSKTEADPQLDKAASKHEKRKAITDSNRRILKTYLEGDYSLHMETWKPRNASDNKLRFKNRFPEFLDRDMATLSKHDINEWQTRMEKRGLAHSTIRRSYAALKALLNQAVSDDLLEANPIQGHRLRGAPHTEQERQKADPNKKQRRLLTGKEMQGILSGLDMFAEEIREQRRSSRKHGKAYLPDLDKVDYPHWFIPFCHLALATGWRPGDLYTLEWEHVDLKFKKRLRKEAEKSRAVAARKNTDATVLDTPLPKSTLAMLRKWHKQQGRPNTGLVFPSPRSGSQLDAQAHRKPWDNVKEHGKLPDQLVFYSLRHHAISAMVAAGVPMLTVARLVGHRDTAMIEKHYGHLSPASAVSAMDIVAATIGEANTRRAADEQVQ